jgi:uncharacterized repeat protein (TIGR02543 family)
MKRIKFFFFFMVFTLLISLHASSAFSGYATLSWDAPVTNADGTPLTDLAGFKVYYGTSSHNYSKSIDVGNVTTYTVNNLAEGVTYYFATSAYDDTGNESNLSTEVMKVSQSAQYYPLTISKNGSGTVTGQGINCGADCTEVCSAGSTVTLTATAATGYTFTGWSGEGCSGTGTCILMMNSAKTVTASFTRKTYAIMATAGSGGSISPSGSVSVNHGSSETFIISASNGYHIVDVEVDGASIGATASYAFSNVTANHSIDAAFASDSLPDEIIIDNNDPGTSYTGLWQASKGSQYYGINSLWARDGATYTWQMSKQPTGIYEVYMWWSESKTRTMNIAVDIIHRDGTTRVYINQQRNAGRWNSLGQYFFDSAGRVTIIAVNGSNVSTCADAVRFRPVNSIPTETIIDNSDAATAQTGIWDNSNGLNFYGVDSVFSRNGSTFAWHFTPLQSGNYEVSMWWTYRDSRSTSVPVDIEYSGGITRVYINQRQNGGMWNVLDTYPFEAGVTYRVTITAQPYPSSSSTTCADAVRFVFQ